jgi:hypothetical protein
MSHLTVYENVIGFTKFEKQNEAARETFENPHCLLHCISLGI